MDVRISLGVPLLITLPYIHHTNFFFFFLLHKWYGNSIHSQVYSIYENKWKNFWFVCWKLFIGITWHPNHYVMSIVYIANRRARRQEQIWFISLSAEIAFVLLWWIFSLCIVAMSACFVLYNQADRLQKANIVLWLRLLITHQILIKLEMESWTLKSWQCQRNIWKCTTLMQSCQLLS